MFHLVVLTRVFIILFIGSLCGGNDPLLDLSTIEKRDLPFSTNSILFLNQVSGK